MEKCPTSYVLREMQYHDSQLSHFKFVTITRQYLEAKDSVLKNFNVSHLMEHIAANKYWWVICVHLRFRLPYSEEEWRIYHIHLALVSTQHLGKYPLITVLPTCKCSSHNDEETKSTYKYQSIDIELSGLAHSGQPEYFFE